MPQKKLNVLSALCPIISAQMNTPSLNITKTVCAADMEKRLPSRVSRKSLPCPELHDSYRPVDEHDFAGFIRVEPKDVREMKRRRNAQRAIRKMNRPRPTTPTKK